MLRHYEHAGTAATRPGRLVGIPERRARHVPAGLRGRRATAAWRPQYVIERLGPDRRPGGDLRRRRRPAPDVGGAVHQVREAEHLAELRRRGHDGLRGSGGHGCQGRPARTPTVWAIDGDGCFQMTNQELATCAINNIPIKVAIINNGKLGMVRQWQTLFYDGRYSQHRPGHALAPHPGLREAGRRLRLRRICVASARRVDAAIEQALATNDRPVVIDFIVGARTRWCGRWCRRASNDEIQAARGIAPDCSTTRPKWTPMTSGTADRRTRCRCWSRTSRVC